MNRLATAGEMSTAFWKQSCAAAVLPARRCAAARSRCSLRDLLNHVVSAPSNSTQQTNL